MRSAGRNAVALLFACTILSACVLTGTQPPAPTVSYGLRGGADSTGFHTVSAGETLWVISERYKLSMQDIIRVNRLEPPYELAAMQRLKLPPPTTYKVKENDTLYGISRTFNLSQSQIARLNDMRAPYAVKPGQSLRLPAGQPVYNPPPAASPARIIREKLMAQTAAKRPAPVIRSPLSSPPPPAIRSALSSVPPRASSRFMWPVDGPIISAYGPKKGGLHNDGINIRAAKGAPVRAAENGTVVYAGNDLKGFGNLVLVRHADRWITAYAHMDRMMVKKGQVIRQGESIGTVGSTGSVDAPQLHFETRRGTEAINPIAHLAQRGT